MTYDAFQARATHAPHRANLRCLGLSVGIAIALSGCNPPSDPLERRINTTLWVETDPETGCHYLVTNTSGITPKLRRDGRPDCPASAIEAQRAETVQRGSVADESAVPQGDAR